MNELNLYLALKKFEIFPIPDDFRGRVGNKTYKAYETKIRHEYSNYDLLRSRYTLNWSEDVDVFKYQVNLEIAKALKAWHLDQLKKQREGLKKIKFSRIDAIKYKYANK